MSQAGLNNVATGSLPPSVPLQFTTDSGVAVPAANNLNIFGGVGAATSASGATVTVTVVSSGIAWSDVSGAFSPLKSNGYFVTGTATGTLPASPVQGDTIQFFVDHATQFLTIDAPGTQIIRMGSVVSSAGGTFTSTAQGDSCELVYRASDTCWCAVTGIVGTWNQT